MVLLHSLSGLLWTRHQPLPESHSECVKLYFFKDNNVINSLALEDA